MDDFILIHEIEKRRQLYDHGDPNYKDKRQRDAGWRAVSEAVGITGEYFIYYKQLLNGPITVLI